MSPVRCHHAPQPRLWSLCDDLYFETSHSFAFARCHARKNDFGNITWLLSVLLLPLVEQVEPNAECSLLLTGNGSLQQLTCDCPGSIITWFTHDVYDPTTTTAGRLVDAFLCSHPLLPMHVAVALLVHPLPPACLSWSSNYQRRSSRIRILEEERRDTMYQSKSYSMMPYIHHVSSMQNEWWPFYYPPYNRKDLSHAPFFLFVSGYASPSCLVGFGRSQLIFSSRLVATHLVDYHVQGAIKLVGAWRREVCPCERKQLLRTLWSQGATLCPSQIGPWHAHSHAHCGKECSLLFDK
jgi:hypothetical protein